MAAIPTAVIFGLVLQWIAMPAEAASLKREQQRFAQSLQPFFLDQLFAIADRPWLSLDVANMVKDDILRRVRTGIRRYINSPSTRSLKKICSTLPLPTPP